MFQKSRKNHLLPYDLNLFMVFEVWRGRSFYPEPIGYWIAISHRINMKRGNNKGVRHEEKRVMAAIFCTLLSSGHCLRGCNAFCYRLYCKLSAVLLLLIWISLYAVGNQLTCDLSDDA